MPSHKPGTLVRLKDEPRNHVDVFQQFQGLIGEITGCDDVDEHGESCLINVYFHNLNQQKFGFYFSRFDILWEADE